MAGTPANARSAPVVDNAAPGGRTALYRFYDTEERLLYVGISNDPWRRRKEHAVTQPWFEQVRHQAITWYDSEWQAREAETRAIRSEGPEFNKAGAIRAAPFQRRITIRPIWWVNATCALGIPLMALVLIECMCQATPLMRILVVPPTIAVCIAMPITVIISLVLVGAPWIRRFGAWIERNSVWPEPQKPRPHRGWCLLGKHEVAD